MKTYTVTEWIAAAELEGGVYWLEADGEDVEVAVPVGTPNYVYGLRGDGHGGITLRGDGDGDCWRYGDGNGDCWRIGDGDGDCWRGGDGSGDCWRYGDGSGDCRRNGDLICG